MIDRRFGGWLVWSLVILGQGILLQPIAAQDEKALSYTAYVEAGSGYSSNLNIEALEWASGESDIGVLVEGGVEAAWRPESPWRVDSGYNYRASRYEDVDQLNLSAHMLYVDASYEFDLITVGGNYYFTDADLDGDGFLILNRYSTYVGRMLEDYLYVRAAINVADKDFRLVNERDADNIGFSVDSFWFFNGGGSSLNIGYDYEDEKTRAERFEYDAITLRLLFRQNLSLLQREASLDFKHSIQLRDYANESPAITRERDDTRNVMNARLIISWTDNFDLIGTIERAEYQSDMASADYNETSVQLSGKFRF